MRVRLLLPQPVTRSCTPPALTPPVRTPSAPSKQASMTCRCHAVRSSERQDTAISAQTTSSAEAIVAAVLPVFHLDAATAPSETTASHRIVVLLDPQAVLTR